MTRATRIAAAAWLLAAGTPAGALEDVTGTYAGKLKCAGLASGAVSKFKRDVTVTVFEFPDLSIMMIISAMPAFSTATLQGFLAEDLVRTDRGRLAAVECPLSYANSVGAAAHADVVVKPGGAKATLKGTVIDMSEPGAAALLCTFTAKRTSTAPPNFPICF